MSYQGANNITPHFDKIRHYIQKNYNKKQLLNILIDCYFEKCLLENNRDYITVIDRNVAHRKQTWELQSLSWIQKEIESFIIQTATSDTLENGFWIDKMGFHKIYLEPENSVESSQNVTT
jgi:hypothetical protein